LRRLREEAENQGENMEEEKTQEEEQNEIEVVIPRASQTLMSSQGNKEPKI
jgi:hypothetical protein